MSSALKAPAIAWQLLYTSSANVTLAKHDCPRREGTRTAGDEDPEEVHEKVVSPEIVSLRTGVCDAIEVVVEHARSVVENVAVDLTHGDNDLERVSHGVLLCDQPRYDEGERAPGELCDGGFRGTILFRTTLKHVQR